MNPDDYVSTHLRNLPDGLEREILKQLSFGNHYGNENACNREKLLSMIRIFTKGLNKTSDRQMRVGIENLRNKGVRICNAVDGDGYFIAKTDEEYQQFRLKYGAYARSIFRTIKAMDEGKEVMDGEIIEPAESIVQGSLF